MDFYNDPLNIISLNREIIGLENMDKALARADRVDVSPPCAIKLLEEAKAYSQKSEDMKRKICLRNTVMVVGGVLVVILIVLLVA